MEDLEGGVVVIVKWVRLDSCMILLETGWERYRIGSIMVRGFGREGRFGVCFGCKRGGLVLWCWGRKDRHPW